MTLSWRKISLLALFLSYSAHSLEDVSLQLKWFHQFQFAGYYMAKEKGYFEDAGFNVEIIERDLSSSPVENVLSGKATFGISDSSIVLQRLLNAPVVITSTIFQTSPLVYISLKEQNIRSPYDLINKRIMFQRNVDDASLQAILHMFNLNKKDFTHVPHNFNDSALIEGEADVMSAYLSDQPILYKNKGYEINIIDPSSYGIDFYGDLIFTSEAYAKNNIKKINLFTNAILKGWAYALENQNETVDLILQKYNPDLNREKLREEAKIISNIIKYGLVPLGTTYPERFKNIARIYQELGMAKSNTSIEGLFVDDYKGYNLSINLQLLSIIIAISILTLAFILIQYSFNLKLKKTVLVKTTELQQSNDIQTKQLSQLLDTNQKLEHAKHTADIANAAKSDFVANMSHEIRTPMNGVLGSLQILQRLKLEDEAKDLINTAIFSSNFMLTIINDILDFSKIEAKKLTLELLPFNLSNILDLLCSELSESASQNGNTLNVNYDENYKEGWIGDPVRVKQILLNLTSNSLKFTNNGHVNINIAIKNSKLEFTISDTGIGMSQDEMKILFQRFEQANKSTTRKFGGTGLGMTITKSLVELMNGRVEVTSVVNEGTSFKVTLPLKQTALSKSRKIIPSTPPDLTNISILLAEDNRINQKIFLAMMKPTNANIFVANDGVEAVDYMKQDKPDIIFLDIQMPNLDGVSACKLIKEQSPDIPIIALTANVMEDDVKKYKAAGFNLHLGKPLHMDELYETLHTFII